MKNIRQQKRNHPFSNRTNLLQRKIQLQKGTIPIQSYDQFKLAIYCTAGCLNHGLDQIETELAFFEKHLKLSKVYIESHRGDQSLSLERLKELKAFFEDRGIETAGGITPTLGNQYRPGYERLFGGICYTDPASRAAFQEAVETAAHVFDELIFDDFFFTNCGCDDCLKKKGSRSWEAFRLDLMTEVSEKLIIKPAKAINPDIKLVIKFPNWNEAYQSSGYNTETQPGLFDGIYTGTETRDPAISQQHIPRYASYSLMRWMENLAPGRNGGGWFDTLDCTFIDFYLEQANLTVFSKAQELTLFNYSNLKDHVYTPALGFQLEKLDEIASHLGKPVGIKVYEPHHAKGEDHLYDYLGMLGLPFELSPHFPVGNETVLITANAARDSHILDKMEHLLLKGGHVIMTSGFIERMAGRGIERFTSIRPTGKKIAIQDFAIETASCTFETFCSSREPISFPLLEYGTNSSWQAIVGLNGQMNIPILMWDNYSRGKLFTLSIPDNYADLWNLPTETLNALRSHLLSDLLDYQLMGPAEVGVFSYDNGTFILETFRKTPEKWRIRVPQGNDLTCFYGHADLKKAAIEEDGSRLYDVRLSPSTFACFKIQHV